MTWLVRVLVIVTLVIGGLLPAAAAGAAQTRCEGFGASTPGGAGGSVYRVTTLADSGPGSLRDAVSEGNRRVVFDVAGEIALVDQIFVRGAFITIDGTTAPAPGITLHRGGLVIRGSRGAHDVIVKGLRIRQAPGDGIQVAFGAYNVVIDGVSIAHSFDGNVDVSGSSDVTICRSLSAEPLGHGITIADGASRVTMHDNLITRSLVNSPGAHVDELGTPASDTTLDMRNNVILNWDNGWGTAIHHGAKANVVKNLYFSSASLPEDQASALIVCKGDCDDDPASLAWAYVAGNRSGTVLPFDLNAEGNATEPFPAPAGRVTGACSAAHRTVAEAGVRPLDALDDRVFSLFVRLPALCSVDLLVTGITPPPGIQAGSTVPVDVLLKNRGPGAIEDPTTVRVFLSSSNSVTLDPDTAVEVGSATAPTVAVEEVVTVTVPVSIPDTAGASGFYRLFAVADADDDLVETNEGNNVTSVDVRVGPDLTIDVLTAPGWAQAGRTVSVTDTVRNRGFSPSGATKVRFYFTTAPTVDGSAVVIGERALAALAEGTTATASTTVTVPLGAGAVGTYYIVAVVDPDAAVIEMDESNNVRASRVMVGPDMVVDGVSGPATAMAGATITVTDTTRNRGVSPAGASVTRFHVSTKPTFDETAVAIGQREVPALAAGATSTGSATVTIPAGLGAASTYYILAMADATGAVVEAEEANNTTGPGWRVMIGPDLVVDALSGPATAMPGATVALTDTTRNRGSGPAAATITRYYFSTRTTFDGEAVALGARPVPSLAPTATSTGSITVAIPSSLGVAGSYYVLAVADAEGTVVESDETNNAVRSWRITIAPDLTVDAVSGPTTAVAGHTITVTDTVRNKGLSEIGPTTTRYYLSTKLTLDGDAVPIGSRSVPGLAVLGTNTGSASVVIPAAAGAAGTYYVLAVADGSGAIAELDEANNVRAARIMIGPDLVVDAVSAPVAAVGGTVVPIADTTRNRGVSASAPSITRFYLSPAPGYVPEALLLGGRAVPALAPTATSSATTDVTIPWFVGDIGIYYVVAVADGAGAVAEPDETNNARAARIAIGPDLIIDSAIVPASVPAGASFHVTDHVRNRGVGPAASSTLRFYLSTRKTHDPFLAIPLGTRTVRELAAGESDSGTTTLTMPASTPPGFRYLVGVVDPGNRVTEMNEDNNGRYWVITIP